VAKIAGLSMSLSLTAYGFGIGRPQNAARSRWLPLQIWALEDASRHANGCRGFQNYRLVFGAWPAGWWLALRTASQSSGWASAPNAFLYAALSHAAVAGSETKPI
jgi:hypothetical protein